MGHRVVALTVNIAPNPTLFLRAVPGKLNAGMTETLVQSVELPPVEAITSGVDRAADVTEGGGDMVQGRPGEEAEAARTERPAVKPHRDCLSIRDVISVLRDGYMSLTP